MRRVENVAVTHRPGIFSKKGPIILHVGRRVHETFGRVHRDEFRQMFGQTANYPVCFGSVGERSYWLFQNRWHWDNEGLNAEQVYALLVTRAQRSEQRINRAQAMVAMQRRPTPGAREAIPADVKQLVWMRDRGSCRRCGSNVELQFDHVIPHSLGGANTPENLQILCGPCNRRKGASIV